MNRETLRRVEALERNATARCVVWIDPPEGGLAGWEILPGDGRSLRIWRDDDETDDELQGRAADAANRHRGVIVVFGMDAQGVTR